MLQIKRRQNEFLSNRPKRMCGGQVRWDGTQLLRLLLIDHALRNEGLSAGETEDWLCDRFDVRDRNKIRERLKQARDSKEVLRQFGGICELLAKQFTEQEEP